MAPKTFSSFLKPPKYLEMPAVGIEITDTVVRFAELKNHLGQNQLGRFGEIILPAGTVEKGHILKPEELLKVLRKIREENNFHFVKSSLPEEESYLFKLAIPRGLNLCEEIRQNIEFRLEENVPLSVAESVFDYFLIEKSNGEQEASVSVVPLAIVETYTDLLTRAGFQVISYDVESKAVAKSVVRRGDQAPYLVINIKDRSTTIMIIENGVVQYTTTASIGGYDITEAIKRNMALTFDEAKKRKEQLLFVESKDSIELFNILINFVSAIKDETEKFYSFWRSRSLENGRSGQEIKKAYLCGKDSALVGFEKYLTIGLKMEVELCAVWQNIFSPDYFLPSIKFLDSLNYAVPVGLFLKGNDQ